MYTSRTYVLGLACFLHLTVAKIPVFRFLLMLLATGYDVKFLLLLSIFDGDRALFRHNHRFYNVLQGGMDVAPSSPKACDVLLGTPAASLDLFLQDKGTESSNSNICKKLLDNNNIICLQEVHGKDEFFQANQELVPRFRLFGTFFFLITKMREDFCIHRGLLPEGAIVTHLVTCQGRDHLVNIHP